MSPRLRQITEDRAHAAYWKAIGLQVLAIHLGFASVALIHARSLWAILVVIVTGKLVAASWRQFRKASANFRSLDLP